MNNIEYTVDSNSFQYIFAFDHYNRGMYYNVLVGSQRYHKQTPLTYSSVLPLNVGDVVEISLQNQKTLGIITKKVNKPTFHTKSVNKIIATRAIGLPSLELIRWIKQYYPAPNGMINALLVPSFLLGKIPVLAEKKHSLPTAADLPPLTTDQANAVQVINKAPGHSALLHGDTGTGKTRVYIELAKKSIKSGRSVIVLTPEIGLTPQLVGSFIDVFPDDVVLLHSRLTPKQRLEAWWTIHNSPRPIVVIGPRSALFAPLESVGLIVVDEMHDTSYKQEQAPYYETTRVAAKLAELHQAKAIFGSATPNIADYYVFEKNKLPIIRMQQMAAGTSSPVKTTIVDLKNRSDFKNSSTLSSQMIDAVTHSLEANEQSLIFLNRRGTARIILCQACGWQATCVSCDLPLTYHGDTHKASCHTCGYSTKTPTVCPSCNSENLLFRSAGTKSIVSELERIFPNAKIKRFDSDLGKKEKLESNYESVQSGEIDILVGTQMLGKGLDLPQLSLVGIVLADTALNFPDYTAQERTYQMLNQVIGRVGRGHKPGRVIIQTYNPNSPVIKQAISKDYLQFYTEQLTERQQFNFPPNCYILKLACSRKSSASAQKAAISLAEQLRMDHKAIEIIGPTSSFTEKTRGSYSWQIIIKSLKRSNLTAVIGVLPANWTHDIDPSHLL